MAAETFRPVDFQTKLPVDNFIVPRGPAAGGGDVDEVPFDVVFVGAGPAGLSGAIELARLAKEAGLALEIGVLEKAPELGGHTLSGSVINPVAFRELFPDLKDADFPFRRPVAKEKVFLLSAARATRIPTPHTMRNGQFYIASLSEAVRWLGERAEAAGVNVMPGFPVESLVVEGERVVGVRTTPTGLRKNGDPDPGGTPSTSVSAKVTVLSDGSRTPLGQAYVKWRGIPARRPQIYALGVKEIWSVPRAPDYIAHTLGWPFPNDTFGGSFMYPLADDRIALGLVGGLDYGNARLDVHLSLQHLKTHKLFSGMLAGGQCLEWGAKTIPEGGFLAIPERQSGDGFVMVGDTLGLVNVPALKGIHYAMKSGILAARAIFAALRAGDTSARSLSAYDQALKGSYVFDELRPVRNIRHAFKSGFYTGGLKAGIMSLSGGAFPGDKAHPDDDADHPKSTAPATFPTAPVGLSKVDAVYLSGNRTRDDIPSHLIVGKDVPPAVADFYAALCPAGVYERQGDRLVVNAPNCIDCKATDVLGPRWSPREGGSGPRYREM